MLDRLFIPVDAPRDISSFNATFHEGLYTYKLFGSLFLIAGIFFLIVAIFKIRIIYPYTLIVIVISLGYYMRRNALSIAEARKACYVSGSTVIAEVIRHQKKFNPFKSSQDYAIVLSFINGNQEKVQKTIAYKSDLIWETNPVGGEVLGLVFEDHSFFGEEIGTTFKFIKKNKE